MITRLINAISRERRETEFQRLLKREENEFDKFLPETPDLEHIHVEEVA